MDVVAFVVKSKEMESLRQLCVKMDVDYRVILKDRDGISATIGTMSRKGSEEIIDETIPAEAPSISLPNLPFCYDELFSAENQYEMVKFVLVLVQLYIGKNGNLGEGIHKNFLFFNIIIFTFRSLPCVAIYTSSLDTSSKT